MKSLFFLAIKILGIIIAAICLPAIWPFLALMLYGSLWIMLKFGAIQKILNSYKDYLGEDVYNLYLKPIEDVLPQIQMACVYLCGYAVVLVTAELTPFLTPFYWGFDQSNRFWFLHIAVLILLMFNAQTSMEHKNVKVVLSIAVLILFISPTFMEGRVWHTQKGSTITYEIPEYGTNRWVHWHWDINDGEDIPPFQVKLNDGAWFENGQIPSGYKYGGDNKLKKISIRTKPVDEYDVKIEIWPSLTP